MTVTAVRPPARFGELELAGDSVLSFKEKPQLHEGWINGGFFVVEPGFFDLIAGDDTLLEREPMEIAASSGQLMSYNHSGFWHCMDSKRDHELLESLWEKMLLVKILMHILVVGLVILVVGLLCIYQRILHKVTVATREPPNTHYFS